MREIERNTHIGDSAVHLSRCCRVADLQLLGSLDVGCCRHAAQEREADGLLLEEAQPKGCSLLLLTRQAAGRRLCCCLLSLPGSDGAPCCCRGWCKEAGKGADLALLRLLLAAGVAVAAWTGSACSQRGLGHGLLREGRAAAKGAAREISGLGGGSANREDGEGEIYWWPDAGWVLEAGARGRRQQSESMGGRWGSGCWS